MKKFGFTLVEVLMTLGIIGVIGMLVTPSLMQNGRNETNAARLSTAVSNFENALATGMAADGAEDLYHWDVWTDAVAGQENAFYGNLTRFMVLNGHEDGDNLTVGGLSANLADMGTDGSRGAASGLANAQVYTALRTKNGALIYINNKQDQQPANPAGGANGEATEQNARENGRTMYSRAADIIIDVNGEAGPNIVGRDVFAFMLSNEGVLYPNGSQEVFAYGGNAAGGGANNPLWINGCNVNNAGQLNITNSASCTARVVENGYRIDY